MAAGSLPQSRDKNSAPTVAALTCCAQFGGEFGDKAQILRQMAQLDQEFQKQHQYQSTRLARFDGRFQVFRLIKIIPKVTKTAAPRTLRSSGSENTTAPKLRAKIGVRNEKLATVAAG